MSKINGAATVSWCILLVAIVAASGVVARWATTCDAWIAWAGISLSGLVVLYTQFADYKEIESGAEPSFIAQTLDKLGRRSIERTFEARVKRFKITVRFAFAAIAILAVGSNTFIVSPVCKARSELQVAAQEPTEVEAANGDTADKGRDPTDRPPTN